MNRNHLKYSLAILIVMLACLFLYMPSIFAATYYVDASRPDNSGDGTSWATAKKNIYPGIKLMKGGDTLIVKSGIYNTQYQTGKATDTTGDTIHHVPSGIAGNPTTIKADVDFGVILTGIGGGGSYSDYEQQAVVTLVNVSYVNIEGFLIKNAGGWNKYSLSAVELNNTNHCKIRKIGVKNGVNPIGEYGGAIHVSGSYNLVEDSFACGMMRYGIWGSGGKEPNYNIFRRCIVRWDYCTTTQPRAAITWYGNSTGVAPSGSMYMQNCIAIDGNNGETGSQTFTGGFSVPHETSGITRYGCISLKNYGFGFHSSEDSLSRDNTNTQCINWDSTSGTWWRNLGSGISGVYNCTSNKGVSGGNNGPVYCEAKNNVVVGSTISNMKTIVNTVTKNNSDFLYIVRSPDLTAGATIEKQYGVTGALYGEPGWDTLTEISLWPWPHEEAIRALFKEPNTPPAGTFPLINDTNRGFCADGETLTNYIWNYLGHGNPFSGVEPVSNPPVANDQSVSLAEDTPAGIILTGSDIDGDPLTFSIMDLPGNGILAGNVPNLTYTPSTNYNGSDAFTFKVNDGKADSNIATVSITVTAVNDPPVTPQGLTATVLGPDSINLMWYAGSDPDNGDIIQYNLFRETTPVASNLSVISYTDIGLTPNTSYSYQLEAVDSSAAKSEKSAIVNAITQPLPNHIPEAFAQSVITDEDTPKTIILEVIDADGDPLTYSIVNLPGNGILAGNVPNLTYTPSTNYNGSDAFTFKVNDGKADSNIATVSITVTAVNDPPVIDSISANPVSGQAPLTVYVTASAADTEGAVTYNWDFGDGTIASSASASHTYNIAGSYIAVLTVTDNQGLTVFSSQTILVQTPITVPAAPSNLITKALSRSQIKLTWADNSDNETGFKIERSRSPTSGFTEIATVGAGYTSYTSSELNRSTTYYHRVCAYNIYGKSAYSNTAYAKTFRK